jgi:hypothetical protein
MNRRAFAKAVAAGALANAALPTEATAREVAPAASAIDVAQQQEPSATARALAQVLRERFGSRFSEEQYGGFTRDIESGLRRAATLRQQRMSNANEPAHVFLPFRRES